MTREGGRTWLTRRVVFLALLSLLLGFVTTWLLAWACAVYVVPQHLGITPLTIRPTTLPKSPPVPPSAYVNVSPRAGWGCDEWHMSVLLSDERPLPTRWKLDHALAPAWSVARRSWRAGQPAPPSVAPSYVLEVQATAAVPAHIRHSYTWTEARSGWPMRCQHWWRTRPRGARRDFHGAFEPPDWLMGTSGQKLDAALPFVPCWAGLIVDTLFFTLLWFAALTAPRTVPVARRLVVAKYGAWMAARDERVLCPHCGYDLRGCEEPGCPECGHGRE